MVIMNSGSTQRENLVIDLFENTQANTLCDTHIWKTLRGHQFVGLIVHIIINSSGKSCCCMILPHTAGLCIPYIIW